VTAATVPAAQSKPVVEDSSGEQKLEEAAK
jgi:hypothetical protein